MRGNAAKRWCFTWNNYPDDWWAPLAPSFEGSHWLAGEEVGASGTKHLQGYVEFPIKVRPAGYKGLPLQIHWEAAKGDRAANVKYCTKDGKVHGNIKVPRPLPVVELYGWQLDAQTQFQQEPDARSIFWWWSKDGSKGKSTFVRWLVRQGALICSGKAADMKYMIVKYHEKKGDYPDCVVFDVPRSMSGYLSYAGIEEIKNGVFASTKFECEPVEMPYPHVFVMANFAPELDSEMASMSVDRFVVNEIE
mgnify:CR=1 FL=1|jgi:hypothetical protein